MLSRKTEIARLGRDIVSLLRDSDIGCSEECLCEWAAATIESYRAALAAAAGGVDDEGPSIEDIDKLIDEGRAEGFKAGTLRPTAALTGGAEWQPSNDEIAQTIKRVWQREGLGLLPERELYMMASAIRALRPTSARAGGFQLIVLELLNAAQGHPAYSNPAPHPGAVEEWNRERLHPAVEEMRRALGFRSRP